MSLSKAEAYLKMMNDIAKCKTPKATKQFKIEVLTRHIEQPKEGITKEDIEMFRRELKKVNQED